MTSSAGCLSTSLEEEKEEEEKNGDVSE